MKLGLIQMNSGEDRDLNVERACTFIDQAAKEEPDLIVLPEFFNSFYFCQYRDYKYMKLAEHDSGYTISKIRERAIRHKVHIIATIYEIESPGIYFDTAMVINPEGQIVGKYRKTHPAAYRSLEKIYFRYGSKFPVFRIKDWKVGIVICYDLFFPESARCVMLNGAELIVVPFCSPAGYLSSNASSTPISTGKKNIDREMWYHQWDTLMTWRAFENTTYLAPCNHVGQEGDAVFEGGTRIVDPLGIVLTDAGSNEKIITAELDRDRLIEIRATSPFIRDRRPDLYKAITRETEDLLLRTDMDLDR